MGFVAKSVTASRGVWKLEQLGPIDACILQADLVRIMGDGLRSVLRQVLAILGSKTRPGEGPFARAERVLKALESDPRGLVDSIIDRPWEEITDDADRVGEALVDLLRPFSPEQVRRLAATVLVRAEGRKGGLWMRFGDGLVEMTSLDELDAALSAAEAHPLEFWRIFAWALELNLRPLIAALAIARSSAASPESPGTSSSAPTPTTPGRSTS